MFQSEVLDAHISLADLRRLSRDDLASLALEVRGRLALVQEELVACRAGAPCSGLEASVVPALADLEAFLSYFEQRVQRHRQRLPRMSRVIPLPALLLPLQDVARVCEVLRGGAPSNISVFAGRIADAGVDPLPIMRAAVEMANDVPGCEVIWASPREVYNVVQAHDIACHIITATPDIIRKLPQLGKDLAAFSLETVRMFHEDSTAAGFDL